MTNASRSWLGEMVEATRRVVAFGSGGTSTRTQKKPRRRAGRRKSGDGKLQKRAVEVRKLAAAGIDRCEIARRTRMSQDTVGMLLNLSDSEPADSAGEGSFFRILQTRMAA
ncbi:MAG: hypothetical protein WD766_12185 [Gemmatimonadota bacterium]